jgi:hypothetical protein
MSVDRATAEAYAAVLADLEAQRIKIEEAIATVKAVQAGSKIPTGVAPAESPPVFIGAPIKIALDAFHTLTVSQAIKKYLGMRDRTPATTAEIVEALTAGGQSGADGSNFTVVVNNTLNRMQAPDGGISKVRRGVWGLKEWYESKPKE